MAVLVVTKYYWEFGDGFDSFEKDPVHIYEMPGAYNYRLTVSMNDGSETVDTGTVYVYDYSYDLGNINASKTEVCYRVPVRTSEGVGVSEYKDSVNAGADWVWPPASLQIGTAYDEMGREIALVLDAKTQREYQINDFDAWKDRGGTYEGNKIISEVHQKAHSANGGEHIPIRHIEHHEYFKSFDRKNLQNASGYDGVGLPTSFRVDNHLFQDEEPFTPVVTTERIPENGDIVFQEKVEARNLQLRTTIHEAPYFLTGVVPYYETVNKQSNPSLRVMSEDGYQEKMSSLPLFHISRNLNPVLNLATGSSATGSYTSLVTGADSRAFSGLLFNGGTDGLVDTLPAELTGDFSAYLWINNLVLGALPARLYAMHSLTVDILNVAGVYTLSVVHNGITYTSALDTDGSSWTLITLVRDGLNLKFYEGITLLNTFAIPSAVSQGTLMSLCDGSQISVFDVCVVPSVMSVDVIKYYHKDVLKGGEEVLQPF